MPIDPDRPFRSCARFYADRRHRISTVLARFIVSRLELTTADRLLDLGCGPAVLAELFASSVAEVVAVDPEPEMLAEGVRRCTTAGVANVTFVRASSDDLAPLAAGSPFAAVTIGQAFHWMGPQDEVLRRLDPLVSGSGAVVLTNPGVVGEQPSWRLAVERSLDEFIADVPSGYHPGGRHAPFDEILRSSPFAQVEQLTFEYDTIELPSLTAELELRYSISWVLDRLGDRRVELEADAHERLGWIDGLGPQRVRRRDTALIGFRR
jgi:SAM-dependent methyltransferase